MTHKDDKKPVQITDYTVLGMGDLKDGWHVIATGAARTAKDAIQNVLLGQYTYQTYVAVPSRSWKPMSIKTETKTITTIYDVSQPEPESNEQPQSQNEDQQALQPQQ